MKHIKGYIEILLESRTQKALDSALIDDIVDGDLHGCIELLESGADPNAKSTKPLTRKGEYDYNLEITGYTAIQVAILKMNFGIFKLLLSHGADPTIPAPDGSTTLVFTLNLMRKEYAKIFSDENEMMIRLLLRSGSRADEKSDYGYWSGITPLHIIVSMISDASRIIRLLIDKGADPNALAWQDGERQTPLSWLLRELGGRGRKPSQERINNAKELIKAGANPFLSFEKPDEIIKFFDGDISWMPEQLRKKVERAQKVRGVFGK